MCARVRWEAGGASSERGAAPRAPPSDGPPRPHLAPAACAGPPGCHSRAPRWPWHRRPPLLLPGLRWGRWSAGPRSPRPRSVPMPHQAARSRHDAALRNPVWDTRRAGGAVQAHKAAAPLYRVAGGVWQLMGDAATSGYAIVARGGARAQPRPRNGARSVAGQTARRRPRRVDRLTLGGRQAAPKPLGELLQSVRLAIAAAARMYRLGAAAAGTHAHGKARRTAGEIEEAGSVCGVGTVMKEALGAVWRCVMLGQGRKHDDLKGPCCRGALLGSLGG